MSWDDTISDLQSEIATDFFADSKITQKTDVEVRAILEEKEADYADAQCEGDWETMMIKSALISRLDIYLEDREFYYEVWGEEV